MENQCQHMIEAQRNELHKLLQKSEAFFEETLGTWKTYTVDLKLKEDAYPICSRLYTVPKVHGENFKREVGSLVLI